MSGDPVLRVTNARLYPTPQHGSETYDLVVEGNRFTSLVPSGTLAVPLAGETRVIDAEGRFLSPPLVDPHVHLDCVLGVGDPRHNQTGTLLEAIQIWSERKPSLTVAGLGSLPSRR